MADVFELKEESVTTNELLPAHTEFSYLFDQKYIKVSQRVAVIELGQQRAPDDSTSRKTSIEIIHLLCTVSIFLWTTIIIMQYYYHPSGGTAHVK